MDSVSKPFNGSERLARVRTRLTADRLDPENSRLPLNVWPAPASGSVKLAIRGR